MIHNEVVVHSGKHTLKKMTKTQVRNEIKQNGSFHGFICGNRVNPFHIADGWHLGMEIELTDVEPFNQQVDQYEQGLRLHIPGCGLYAHYYQIVNTPERTDQVKQPCAEKV